MAIVFKPQSAPALTLASFDLEAKTLFEKNTATQRKQCRLAQLLHQLNLNKSFLIEEMVREIQHFGELPDFGFTQNKSRCRLTATTDEKIPWQVKNVEGVLPLLTNQYFTLQARFLPFTHQAGQANAKLAYSVAEPIFVLIYDGCNVERTLIHHREYTNTAQASLITSTIDEGAIKGCVVMYETNNDFIHYQVHEEVAVLIELSIHCVKKRPVRCLSLESGKLSQVFEPDTDYLSDKIKEINTLLFD
ncbi:hypothetical protein PALB_34990 [Pseudoalteromonas luteoviolacea B = ATCC 29581]|nr:hypothetical protein PALB_34990 [Pseudoalteromonas luteoviolacea B = ATCC 29581]